MSVVKLTVRLPAALHAALTARARSERKSLNTELVASLQRGLGPEPSPYGDEDARFERTLRDRALLAEPGPVWETYRAAAPDVTEELALPWDGQRSPAEDIMADQSDRGETVDARGAAIKLAVRLPRGVHDHLAQRALDEDLSLNQLIVRAVERLLGCSGLAEAEESDYDRIMRLLDEEGLNEPMGPGWRKLLSGRPLKSAAELRERLRGIPPLSEDIMAERGER